MENPATWNEAKKCIAFHMSDIGNGVADNVVNGLIEKGFLQKAQYTDAWMAVVDGLKDQDRQMKARMCGLSGPSLIYNRLEAAKLL